MSPHAPSEPVTSNDATSRSLAAMILHEQVAPPVPGPFTDQDLWARVVRHARCADGGLDPDEWFPVSAEAGMARQEAAAAIAVCSTCLVRGQCLALSLRHWDIGQHGVWGGLVSADRTGGPGLTVVQADGAAVMSRVRWWLGKGRDVQ